MCDQNDTAYYGLMTSTWDLLRQGQEDWDDRFFFQDLVSQYGEPVLDVGCATGRLILTYLKQGLNVEGVDSSASMLALCREKAEGQGLHPTLHHQRMERLDLPTLYRTIIVSSSSFQLLTDLDSSTAAMAQLHGHLEEGGALVMPFMTLWSEGDPTETDWELTGEATREDGALVRRWTWFRYDVETQLEHVEFRYEVTLDGQVIEEETQRFSPETRSYTQPQAVASYTAAGFEEVRVLEGFDRQHASKDARLFTVVGIRGDRPSSSPCPG
ncbi:MAG: class I SAM-dependent methyltransferase [Candidatus Latescibacteria bacterium]|jgi:SAM-dependent methyltransferase|nr:class I SAM-dependent methyltransferase [Candidatus Latescibacterota bacterium]MDP7447622.1 class I SAM-dependent methyltransferase [Candidatus Latescibacterota bacterium]HJP33275.1 class I SAM-dependent methyltransferase [Candidatus Latescibacterota bacterium]